VAGGCLGRPDSHHPTILFTRRYYIWISCEPFFSLPAHSSRSTMQDWHCGGKKEDVMAKAKSPVPEGYHTVTPQLTFDNAAQAIDWYKKALGAEEKSRAVAPDGKIMHAGLQIGDSRVMLNDAFGGGQGA